jgi:hypothetical protein
MKKLIALLVLATGASLSGVAVAHIEHDEAPVPAHKLELVNNKSGALIYVTNMGSKVSTAGATGKLILVQGAARTEVALKPSGSNAMEAVKPTAVVAGSRASVVVTLADKMVVSDEFAVK